MPAQLIKYTSQKVKGVLLEKELPDSFSKKFSFLLRTQTGYDFSLYKHNTISRRVAKKNEHFSIG